jgi:hypothetical protein
MVYHLTRGSPRPDASRDEKDSRIAALAVKQYPPDKIHPLEYHFHLSKLVYASFRYLRKLLKAATLCSGEPLEPLRELNAAMSSAASSTASKRDERIFATAFGMMDSNQDGEAVAAFMRVRDILHRHGSGFRRLLERSREAEQLNEELGRQNALLRRENAALRARDSRPISPPPAVGRGLLSMPGMTSFRNWDIGLIVIVAVWAGFGLLGITTALSLVAAVLVSAAFTYWFSPVRFFAGLLLAVAAYGTLAPQAAAPPPPTYAVAASKLFRHGRACDAAGTGRCRHPTSARYSLAVPANIRRSAATTARGRGSNAPARAAEPRTRQVTPAKADCGPHRL